MLFEVVEKLLCQIRVEVALDTSSKMGKSWFDCSVLRPTGRRMAEELSSFKNSLREAFFLQGILL